MESRFGDLVVKTFFPRHCVGCRKEGGLLCHTCNLMPLNARSFECAFCAQEGSMRTCSDCREEVFLDGVSFVGPYANNILRGLIHHWKYYGDLSAQEALQELFVRFLVTEALPLHPFYVSHVPLHPSRASVRGFDQAKHVASWVADQLGVPQVNLLERVYSTQAQAQRSVADRSVGLLDNAFSLRAGTGVPKHVLLCDDVFTSGSTMDAAAKVLKESGAEVVWGIVLAKGY